MTSYSTYYLDLLKKCVLKAAGFTHLTSADCRTLSSLITGKTKQRISETTLKRIYGFALSSFKPSLFTVDVLSAFCGYIGWADFCDKHDPLNSSAHDADINWCAIKQNADKITAFTITALKNRSGIPYHQTIKRQFIDQHFEKYLSSGCVGTVFCAPSGYGKTIALCHWVEEKMAQSHNNGSKDIILFFSSSALMSVLLSGRDINDWMLALLGYSTEGDLMTLLNHVQQHDGNFYLIVDGFDEFRFKNERFNITLKQLIDILALHLGNKWLKVILTMRPSTWINYRHEMESIDNIWYTGFKKNTSTYTNVPLFNMAEILELCSKINPSAKSLDADNVVESFNHPLYFQFYYKKYKDEFSFDHIDHIVIYELLSSYIYNHVYLGKLSVEKVLLINIIVNGMDIKHHQYYVDKIKINGNIKQYNQAYQDLLNSGILRELNDSSDYQHRAFIEFGDDHFLAHSIAKCLLNKNQDLFNLSLIHHINTLLNGNRHKLPVLKWCLIHAVKDNQWGNFNCLTNTLLCANEKSDLVIFLSDLLEREARLLKKDGPLKKQHNYKPDQKMFNYFFGLELIGPHYKKTLDTLLKFELSVREKILVYSALGVIAIIQLDLDELYTCLLLLKSYPKENYQSFIVDPLNCLDTFYNFFRYGVVKKDALIQLTKLSFYFPEDESYIQQSAANDMIYLLGLHTLVLAANPKKTIRIIHLFKTRYKPDKTDRQPSHYNFFLQTLLADANFRLGRHDKVSALYFVVARLYNTEELLTPFMKTLFISFKITTLFNTPDEKYIFNELKCLDVVAKEAGNKLARLYISDIILTQQRYLDGHPQLHKQLLYDMAKIIRENELSANAFKHIFDTADVNTQGQLSH